MEHITLRTETYEQIINRKLEEDIMKCKENSKNDTDIKEEQN